MNEPRCIEAEATPSRPSRPPAEHHRVVIVGTGFSGLGAAIRLLQSGERDLVVLERAGDVGGCWRDNTYPGIQCDVQSDVYSFSFAPNASWTRAFPWGGEIHTYLRHCADRFGVRPFLRLHTEVIDAAWDDDAQRWRIETTTGALTAHAAVRDRLQAHPALERLLPRALPAQRGAGDDRSPRGHRRRRGDRGRLPSRRGRHRPLHGLPRRRSPDDPENPRSRRALPRGALGARRARLPRGERPGLPEPLPAGERPHTGLGHNSIVYMIEAQIGYLLAALGELKQRGRWSGT